VFHGLVEDRAVAYPLLWAKLLVRTGIARLLPSVKRLTDGAGPFLPYYSDRLLTAPLPECRDAARLFEPARADALDLASGIPRFDLVPSASTKLPADRRGYPAPDGLTELRQAVAAKVLAEHGLAVQPGEEVLITHGAAGAFNLVLDAFVNPGDSVVLVDPASPLYHLGARYRRARIRWIPTWMENGRLRFHLEPMVKALRGARLVVLNLPANPTGGLLAAEDLEAIAWWAERRDALIWSEEVFEPYRYEGPPVSMASLPHAARRTLIAGSVSRPYALASARVGWLAGHRHLVRPCLLASAFQAPGVPILCQQQALSALRQGPEALAGIRTEFASRRQYAFERLQAMSLQPEWPAGGLFFWIPVQSFGLTGRVFADRLLADKQVWVVPGDLFGPTGGGHIRLSFATEDGRLREGLSRLADFVRDLKGTSGSAESRAA
jgi:aspartate/methionine/tyrosine aminotransferase